MSIGASKTAAHAGHAGHAGLDRIILRNVVTAYFVAPAGGDDREPFDEG